MANDLFRFILQLVASTVSLGAGVESTTNAYPVTSDTTTKGKYNKWQLSTEIFSLQRSKAPRLAVGNVHGTLLVLLADFLCEVTAIGRRSKRKPTSLHKVVLS